MESDLPYRALEDALHDAEVALDQALELYGTGDFAHLALMDDLHTAEDAVERALTAVRRELDKGQSE